MSSKVISDQNFFGIWSKIRRDKVTFMSIGVFSIYGKILLTYSPNMFILFKRVLHALLNTFGVFGDDFLYIKSFKIFRNLRVR